jgi:hypothetical protein
MHGPETIATRVTTPAPLRFAVAVFDTRVGAGKAAEELCSGSNPLCEISYLGLHNVLDWQPAQPLSKLPFAGNAGQIVCSTGPVEERLAARLHAGTPSLQAALTAWLIPRHAAQLQRAVDSGKIVLWVQLVDDADERLAYRTLMAAGCTSVGVHDLVGG